jgi:SAM-dependent methyltransferase
MKPPTERFSNRVDDYVKYRPSYPSGLIETLRLTCGLAPNAVIADVGSGTGIFTALLLEAGWAVRAVEPNEPMRKAAEQRFSGNPKFQSVAGTAECTGLPANSVDLVTAAQAFHWFRMDEAKAEFQRILKPSGWVALIWNKRKKEAPLHQAYDRLLRECSPEYEAVNHDRVTDEVLECFFAPHGYQKAFFPNEQKLDWEGMQGRLRSSSYCPTPEQPEYEPLMKRLRELFDEHAREGLVSIEYNAQLYYGQI